MMNTYQKLFEGQTRPAGIVPRLRLGQRDFA
jgi:hypothetical protein